MELPGLVEALFQLLERLELLCEERMQRGIEAEQAAQVQAILRYRLTRLVSKLLRATCLPTPWGPQAPGGLPDVSDLGPAECLGLDVCAGCCLALVSST